MSEIGQAQDNEKVKFVWTPPARDIPELEFKEMTINELIEGKKNEIR